MAEGTRADGGARRGRGPIDARLVRELPALRRTLAGLGAVTLVGTVGTIAEAVLLARIVAAVFTHPATARVAGDLAGFAAAMVVKACAAGAVERIGHRASATVRARLRHRLLRGVARLGPQWLAGTDRPALIAAAGPGIEGLDGYMTRAVPAVVAAAVTPPLVLAAIGLTDWPTLLILLVTLPLVPVFLALIGVTTRRRMERQWATLGRLSGQFLDLLQGLGTLKVYGRSRVQVDAVRDGTDRYRRETMATLRVAFLSGLVLDLLASLSVAVVAVAVGLRLDHGGLRLAPALTVLLLAPEVFAPLRAVGAQHHATEEARVVIATTMDIVGEGALVEAALLDAADTSAGTGPGGMVVVGGDTTPVRFTGVGYTWPGRARRAVVDVDVVIGGCGLTAVVGASGAGKSTLLALLLGQVVPSAGAIRVGPDARLLGTDATAAGWRAGLAWVPQRPRPTQETVADEVRLGDPVIPDGDLERVLLACDAPSAATSTGEDGGLLSAGQRRRLALARAVARAESVAAGGGTPLVVLDEPTEDLDAATRAVVVDVVTDLAGWAAVVVATHDLALRALADTEVVMTDGIARSSVRRSAGRTPPRERGVIAGRGSVATDPRRSTPAAVTGAASAASRAVTTGEPQIDVRAAIRAAPGAVRALVAATALGALAGISGLALTATSVWLIVRAAEHPNIQALAIAVVGVRTFALAKALLRYAERLATHDGALRLLADVRARVFAALEPLAPAGLAPFRRGDLLRRFTNDVDGAQEALVRAVVPIAGAAATAVSATILATLIDPVAGLVLAAGLIAVGAVVLVAWRTGTTGDTGSATAGRRAGLVSGMIDGLAELTAYDGTDRRLAEISAADADATRAAARPGDVAALATVVTGTVAATSIAAMVAAGVDSVAAGAVAPVLLGVLAVCGLVAFDALGALPSAFAAIGRCLAGLHRVDEVLRTPVPVPEPAEAQRVPSHLAGLVARHVTLAPAPDAVAVLVDAGLVVPAGHRLAIVGPSGAGKSTLLTALLRLLPLRGGLVGIDHGDGVTALCGLRAEDVPPLVAGSLQGDHVFATTLRDNLRLVAPATTDVALDALAERVGLGSWVHGLPEAWSTQTGPDGSNLSGGQRQRLLLARALLADPLCLVLDEPTAHLDVDTEQAVMADLLRSTAGRTLVLSTHRRTVLDSFDHRLSIEGRRLVDRSDVDAGDGAVGAVFDRGVPVRVP